MATGPEHYRAAEKLLAAAHSSTATTFEGHNPEADRLIAAAQVHATLANAVAIARGGIGWTAVCGSTRTEDAH